MTEIDSYSLATVPVEQIANGQPMNSATAFIWKDGRQHYLITNWHVVTGRNARTGELDTIVRPDTLRAFFNLRIQNFGKQQWDIKIRDDEHRPLWFVHPRSGRGVDVVAIPLALTGEEPMTNPYPINEMPSSKLVIRIGMDVFILGYPFGNEPPGFPVWKRGSIASEPDLVRIGPGYLAVDTASRPGMSGSPVILRSWGQHLLENRVSISDNSSATRFIGVYSGRRYTADGTDAQIGIVWPEYHRDQHPTCQHHRL
jgi:hypothetical protein